MSQKSEAVVTRFAPSPTGYLHAGAYRTAVFAYLVARQHKGKFIVRIEDTDKMRSKKIYEDNILESLSWLSLDYDALYRQSEQVDDHRKALETLIAKGVAYVSTEEWGDEKNSGDAPKRREVIRFRNPKKSVTFVDIIHGPITTDTTDLGDFVIAKSLKEPLFHLAVVVDDAMEGITHVIRGDDHIANTPRQILIQEALGYRTPNYAHLPIVLGTDRTKLSKRRGAKAITEYRDMGILPEAVLNYVALVGWHPEKSDEEIFTLQDLVSQFDLSRVQKGGGVFDEGKLLWFSREHLRHLSDKEYQARIEEFGSTQGDAITLPPGALPLIRERAHTLGEALDMLGNELAFLLKAPSVPATMLPWKGESPAEARAHLTHALSLLEKAEAWDAAALKATLFPYAEEKGRGSVLWPLRIALSGQEKSPDPFSIAAILGKQETLARINAALAVL